MKLRRCEEDRWDFSTEDASFFPIKLAEHGQGYGFCPGKVTWDQSVGETFRLLVLCYETKSLLYSGGIAEQPSWFVELISWFIPRYDEYKFYYRAKSILGDSKKTGTQNGNNSRRTKR